VCSIVDHCRIAYYDTILDFGCARGYTVKALRQLGYEAWGVDCSKWAVANCDSDVKQYLSDVVSSNYYDWVIAKDVLEHVPQVEDKVATLMDAARKGVFAVVPLSPFDGAPYVVEDYERDVTHVHRLSLPTWAAMFMRAGWSVETSYRVRGVKDNYASWTDGNGFVTARRLDKYE